LENTDMYALISILTYQFSIIYQALLFLYV